MSDTDDPTAAEEPLDTTAAPVPDWVGELLAGLRADDPPTPVDVVARTDAALAALRHSDPPTATIGSAGPAGPAGPAGAVSGPAADEAAPGNGAASPGSAAGLGTAPVAALDAARHARRSRSSSPWGHRLLLGGVAAAAVLVLGGLGALAVIRGAAPGPAGPVAAQVGQSEQGDAGAEQVSLRYVASGADYAPATLTTEVAQVMAVADGTPAPDRSLLAAPDDSSALRTLTEATTRPDAGCLSALLVGVTRATVLVDEASYTGRPAYVVIVRPGADGTGVDIWVVARTCSLNDDGLITFARM